MLVIATQSMATRDGGVTIDDAIECTDAQGEQLIAEGLARMPDEDDGEPTPRQIRSAFQWPSDEAPIDETQSDEPEGDESEGDQVDESADDKPDTDAADAAERKAQPKALKPKAKSNKKVRNAAAKQKGDPPV